VCKMELREQVLSSDVDEAIRLLKAATYAAAIDPETGMIDWEQLIVGVGAGKRKRGKEIESLLQEIVAERKASGEVLTVDGVKAVVNERLGDKKEQLVTDFEFNSALRSAEQQGVLRRQGKMIEAI
ncbi:unnamed protein product, partial [Polarella glacialis]